MNGVDDGWVDGQVGGYVGECVGGQMDEQTSGWVDSGWMESGQMDNLHSALLTTIDRYFLSCLLQHP